MVALTRKRLESSTIAITMTLRSWLRAGLMKKSILETTDVEEYNSSLNEGDRNDVVEVILK